MKSSIQGLLRSGTTVPVHHCDVSPCSNACGGEVGDWSARMLPIAILRATIGAP